MNQSLKLGGSRCTFCSKQLVISELLDTQGGAMAFILEKNNMSILSNFVTR